MANLSVDMGQIIIGNNEDVIEASGIGSCVVVCLYDFSKKIGGAIHIMLPINPINEEFVKISMPDNIQEKKQEEGRYADPGIGNLIIELEKKGIDKGSLEAKILGGSEMFSTIISKGNRIGPKNIRAVKEQLEKNNIKIISEDLGGNVGRSMKFTIDSCTVDIKKKE